MRMLNHFKFSLHVVARMMGDTERMVRKHYEEYDDNTIKQPLIKRWQGISKIRIMMTNLKKKLLYNSPYTIIASSKLEAVIIK